MPVVFVFGIKTNQTYALFYGDLLLVTFRHGTI